MNMLELQQVFFFTLCKITYIHKSSKPLVHTNSAIVRLKDKTFYVYVGRYGVGWMVVPTDEANDKRVKQHSLN